MRTQVEKSLEPLRSAMEADGYELKVTELTETKLSLRVEALAHACIECLIPADVMEKMVRSTLVEAAPQIRDVTLEYHV